MQRIIKLKCMLTFKNVQKQNYNFVMTTARACKKTRFWGGMEWFEMYCYYYNISLYLSISTCIVHTRLNILLILCFIFNNYYIIKQDLLFISSTKGVLSGEGEGVHTSAAHSNFLSTPLLSTTRTFL